MRPFSKTSPVTNLAIAGLFLTSIPAISADLFISEPDPVPVFEGPVDHLGFDWNRFYGGLIAGSIQGDLDITTNFTAPEFNTSHALQSAIIGLTVGKNFRNNDSNLLFGLEADISKMNHSTAATFDAVAGPPLDDGAAYNAKMDLFATIRGRLGVLAGDEERTLLYVTGGFAAARASASARIDMANPFVTDTGWLTGYTVGGGVESALKENISLKMEYLYSDLTKDLNVSLPGAGNVNFDFRSSHQIRVGLNIHF